MTSKEYWQKRETEHAKKNKMSEQTYAEEIRKTYAYMADQIQKEIDGFYAKYANAEKISLAEAKRRVSKLDIEEYGRKAAKYVKEKDFSDQANEEMRLYNATMKINRLELLKANIGLEMVSGFDELQKYFDRTLTQQTIEEFRRQAGILGNSVQENGKMARTIVDASFHNATYSDRIWMYQDMLKAELDKLLKTGLIQGKNRGSLRCTCRNASAQAGRMQSGSWSRSLPESRQKRRNSPTFETDSRSIHTLPAGMQMSANGARRWMAGISKFRT